MRVLELIPVGFCREKKKEKMMGFWVAGFRGGGSLNFFDW